MKCEKRLEDCTCPDFEERVARLRKCKYLHVPSCVDKPLLARKLKQEQPKPKDQ